MIRMRPRAFTLVEMLSVIAIIGILAAMLIPVINGVRARSIRVSCSSNMRSVAMGFISYSTDEKNRGFLPHEDRDGLAKTDTMDDGNYCWFDLIDEHLDTKNLSRVKQCPGWEGFANISSSGETPDEHSMKMNSKLENIDKNPKTGGSGTWPSDPIAKKYYFFPTQRMRKANDTGLLFDGQTITTATSTKGYLASLDYNRHDGTTNWAMMDASAQGIDGLNEGILDDAAGYGWTAEGPVIWDPWK